MYPGAPLWTPARLGGLWCTLWISDKLFCMGTLEKRLTATQTKFGSAHFLRTWSESALRPPNWPQGPRKAPFPPAPPSPACVGRCWGPFLERLPGSAAAARSPTRLPRPPPGLRPGRRLRSRGRAWASRMVPGWAPGGPWWACYGRSKLGDATRKRGEATRKPAGPPVSARPRPPRAGPRRPRPAAAPLYPQQRLGGRWGAERGGGFLLRTTLAQKPQANTRCSVQVPAQPGPERSPGRLPARTPPPSRWRPLGRIPRA